MGEVLPHTDKAPDRAKKPAMPKQWLRNTIATQGICSQRNECPKGNHSLQPYKRNPTRQTANTEAESAIVMV